MTALRRALLYLRPHWAITLGAFVSLLFVTITSLVSPQLLRYAIDNGITGQDSQALLWACVGLLGVAALRNLFTFTQTYWIEQAGQEVAFTMRNELVNRLNALSFSYHDRAQTGQLMTRVTNDVDTARQFIGGGLIQIVNAILLLIGSAAILLVTNWQLALLVLLMVPAIGFVFFTFFRTVGPRFRAVAQKLGFLNTVLQEGLAGVRVVKAFAREPYEAKRFRSANDDLLVENLAVIRGIAVSFPLIFFIANLGTLLVIWYGGAQVIGGSLSVGDLVAFNSYLAFLLLPIFILGNTLSSIAQADASARRVFEVLDAPVEVLDKPDAVTLPRVKGRVVFDTVSFSYTGSEQASISDVSFVAEPGQTVAIIGRTGAGKSTIINLIPRFYEVSNGRVQIDGYDVRDVTLTSLRSQIGIVLQESMLFSGTLRENIAFGRQNATDAEIEAAAKAAQAHDFISALPQGYATIVGERGVGLSGGQRQRVAIARALLLDAPILIMDDSTSAVDTQTEYQIQQALNQLRKGRTTFVIAQRMSTVRNADTILVMEEGRLIAQGSHVELTINCGPYCELIAALSGEGEAVVAGM
jgi:ATP-binding cassette, subfamily B, multidrug efflux pump